MPSHASCSLALLSVCFCVSRKAWGGVALGCRYASHILEREPDRRHHTKSTLQATKKSDPPRSSQPNGGHQDAYLESDIQGDADAVTAAAVAATEGLERRPSTLSSSVEDGNDAEYW